VPDISVSPATGSLAATRETRSHSIHGWTRLTDRADNSSKEKVGKPYMKFVNMAKYLMPDGGKLILSKGRLVCLSERLGASGVT
jgi:hypothetical protein